MAPDGGGDPAGIGPDVISDTAAAAIVTGVGGGHRRRGVLKPCSPRIRSVGWPRWICIPATAARRS